MGALDKQVDGTHYKTKYQPVELIINLKLDFFEGNILKYITRFQKKNGVRDIEKAIHYAEMALEFDEQCKRVSMFSAGYVCEEIVQDEIAFYCEANDCHWMVSDILTFMGLGSNMKKVKELLIELLNDVSK